MVGSASQNLTSFTNPWNGAFSNPGDGFQKYQRGVSPTIPFSVLDDSLVIFPSDTLGIIKDGNLDQFFGVVDTINGDNSGLVSATWEFDITGATGLVLSIDMGAMGDFEASDTFEWTYSIDGGPELTAFASTVDEAGSFTYTLEGGGVITLNDPMLVQGTILTDDLDSFSSPLIGTGSALTLTLTATFDGGTEAVAFQNIVIEEGGVTTAGLAFDMVNSASQNLTSFTNPWNGAFSNPGDGFQKYQRGVSPTIPFSVLDDSLVIFPSDTLGIIKDGNLDEFFGVVDTINGDNSDPVSATWTFDVSAATLGLVLSIDMGAMGDFESSDTFVWTYSIDGGPELTAFANSVDEAGSFTYVLEGGLNRTLADPMLMQGTILTNDFATFNAPLVGTGSTLTLTLTQRQDAGTEAVAFQNIILSEADVPPPPPSELEIFEIQGSGSASPSVGNMVITRDNVVTALGVDGFFMQTPTARTDGDVDTSDGIFVFTGGPPTDDLSNPLAVGDLVDVAGTVQEFFGFTEFGFGSSVTMTGNGTVPAAISLDATVPSPDPGLPSCAIEFECYEGMLIEIAEGTVTGPNQRFGSDPIAEVHITAAPARTFREPGVEFPGLSMPPIPTWDGNPEVFELDPDKLGLPNQIIPAGSSFSATGVIGFEFGGYELWPTALSVTPAPLPVAVRPREPGEFTVGTLNLFRLFDDVDDPPDGDRDDFVASTAEYQRRLTKFSAYIREVLDAPDILAVQEVEKLDVLEELADQMSADDPTVSYLAYLEEGNDIGTIDVGFLVREDIIVHAITQLGKDETFLNPTSGVMDVLHDRPPLLLEASCPLEFGTYPISVMVVHNRSLGGIEGPEAARVRQKRYEQAVSIVDKVEELKLADPDVRLAVIGDFNAFEFTDGYVDAIGIITGEIEPDENLICDTNACAAVPDTDLFDEAMGLDETERYSFIFRGNAQVLDHALTSVDLAAEVSGSEFGRGNADAAVDLINDDGTVVPANKPLRSSDHDGFVIYVLKDEDLDGVPNNDDVCAGTEIPEVGVPSMHLLVNRWALTDGDGVFDTVAPRRGPSPRPDGYSIEDTAGCSCEQIIAEQGLEDGQTKFGCSISVIDDWVDLVSP
jgi:predicted extracellular nuclease